jgi:hypothetical protein
VVVQAANSVTPLASLETEASFTWQEIGVGNQFLTEPEQASLIDGGRHAAAALI